MTTASGNPARQPSLREHNLALVLGQLADGGPASRAQLAASTRLTKATVSSLVETLVDGGLVVELGRGLPPGTQGDARVGRPGSRVALAPTGPVGIGLEINVDYLATCTVDLSGAVRQRQLIADDFRRSRVAHALDRAASAVRVAVTEARSGGLAVAGVAVAVPGLVENRRQLLRLAPNLGWRDVAVLDELRARLADAGPRNVSSVHDHREGVGGAAGSGGLSGLEGLGGLSGLGGLDNEANLAALGELWCGGHTGADGGPLRTFVHVSGEIGVGAGLVVDGRLLRGQRGFSGEVGHLPVGQAAASGVGCSCGSSGCLEQLAGQEAIVRAAGLGPSPSGPATASGTQNGTPDGPVGALVLAAQRGDPAALAAIAQAGTALGTGIAGMLNLVDADTVVLGGLYARLAPWLRPAVDDEIARRTLAAAWSPVRVLVSRLGSEAAVRGAALSVVRGVIADPAAYLRSRSISSGREEMSSLV